MLVCVCAWVSRVCIYKCVHIQVCACVPLCRGMYVYGMRTCVQGRAGVRAGCAWVCTCVYRGERVCVQRCARACLHRGFHVRVQGCARVCMSKGECMCVRARVNAQQPQAAKVKADARSHGSEPRPMCGPHGRRGACGPWLCALVTWRLGAGGGVRPRKTPRAAGARSITRPTGPPPRGRHALPALGQRRLLPSRQPHRSSHASTRTPVLACPHHVRVFHGTDTLGKYRFCGRAFQNTAMPPPASRAGRGERRP